MSYVVDFSKTPKSILLELINSENASTPTEEMFDFLPMAEPTKSGFDTHVPLQWRTTENMIGLLNVYYNRVGLGTLFSLTGINLKEVNLDLDEIDQVIVNDKFYDELYRRGGAKLH